MRRHVATACILGALFLVACGCGKDPAGQSRDDKGRAAAAKGQTVGPITVTFLGFEGPSGGEERVAKMLILNSSDRPIHNLRLTLRYLDASGVEQGTFPWSMSGLPSLLEPGETTTAVMGGGIPADCASVEVLVKEWD